MAAVVRSVTLAHLMHIAKAEHDAYYQSADAIAETVQSTAVLDSARYFSKVAGEIVRGRLMERYYDQFDSVPTLVCIAVGVALCYAARRMLRKAKAEASEGKQEKPPPEWGDPLLTAHSARNIVDYAQIAGMGRF